MTHNVLYWPGRRREHNELALVWGAFARRGLSVAWIEAPYDAGPLPHCPEAEIVRWLMDSPPVTWWIGLSLGAAVAHVVAATIPAPSRPRRLTLINPFADRIELSLQLGFSLKDQWPLRPVEHCAAQGMRTDLVISRSDEHIPSSHGIRLQECYRAEAIRLLELEADHALTTPASQLELASWLLEKQPC